MKKTKLTQNLLKSLIKKTISEEVSTNESWFNRLIGREEEPWPPRAPERSLYWKDPETGEGHWVTKDELRRLEAGEEVDLSEERMAESGRMMGRTGAFRVREPRSIGGPVSAAGRPQSWKEANPGGTWGMPSKLSGPKLGSSTPLSPQEKEEVMDLLSSDRTSPGQKEELARLIGIHGVTSRALRKFLDNNPDIHPA
jgi:hypothetical protein